MDSIKGIDPLIPQICGSKKRHDKVIKDSIREAMALNRHEPMLHFINAVQRKLSRNESLIIGPQILRALQETLPQLGFQLLLESVNSLPKEKKLMAFPVMMRSGQTLLMIISHHGFRAAEISSDIWDWFHPDAPFEERYKNRCITNGIKVSENLENMGRHYTSREILEALSLIREGTSFFLRALFLFAVDIEPKLFVEHLESKGFHIMAVLNEEESEENNTELDFIERLQGFVVAKSEQDLQEANKCLDFVIGLSRFDKVPDQLTDTGQVRSLDTGKYPIGENHDDDKTSRKMPFKIY